jgi:hypothetical protein
MNKSEVASKAGRYGVRSVPAVVIDGKLLLLPTSIPANWQLQILPLDRQRSPQAIQPK